MPIKRVTRPNESKSRPENLGWDGFVRDCETDDYILVVGDNNIVRPQCFNGSSLQMLFDSTVEYINERITVNPSIANFTELDRVVNSLKDRVRENVGGFQLEESFDSEFDPDLYNLLATKRFRLVLTTAVDPYLEVAMRRIWGEKGYRMLNSYGGPAGLPEDIENIEVITDNMKQLVPFKPTLYYMFGKVKPSDKESLGYCPLDFVITENDAMRCIEKWFKSGPANLLQYIRSRKVLCVGCRFDDWLYRFFWYILRGSVENLGKGQVAVDFILNDNKLVDYLRNQRVNLLEDSRAFMREAYVRINQSYSECHAICRQEGIFISYAQEDERIAYPLFLKLSDLGFNVWLDKRIDSGQQYDKEIFSAIKNCRIFMPILTSQTRRDICSGNRGRYYMKEWKWAQERHEIENTLGEPSMVVLPFVCEDYDARADYHADTPECIIRASAFKANGASMDSLVRIINNHLNR